MTHACPEGARIRILAPFLFGIACSAAVAQSEILGKWCGTIGTPLDRVEIAFEFKRMESGEVHAFAYEPVLNFYGLDLQEAVVRDGDAFTVPGHVLSLTPRGDRLEGTFLSRETPVTLARCETLPSEPPIPALPKGPGPRWRTVLGGVVYAAAAVADGVAYVGTTGGSLWAVDTRDGHLLWTFVAGRPIHGEALIDGAHLYFVCDNGYLYALQRSDGHEVWSYDLGDARAPRALPHQVLDKEKIGDFDFDCRSPQPVIADGVLYVGAGDGGFHAVDAATGERKWRFVAQGKVRSTAALHGDRVIFGTFDGLLYSLARKDGTKMWMKNTYAAMTSAPVVIADRLVIGNRSGYLGALDPETGDVRWGRVLFGSAVESTPVAGKGTTFYIGASDLRRVSCFDVTEGKLLWRSDVYGITWPSPALTEDRVFASAAGVHPYDMRHEGGFVAMERATGKVLWRWPVADNGAYQSGFLATPVVSGDTVVVGGLDGNLYGFPAEG